MNAQKRLIQLSNHLTYPRKIEDFLQTFGSTWSEHKVLAKIIEINKETSRCISLTLKPNSNWEGAEAGQYVMLTLYVDGKKTTRCFTISQHNTDTITLTIQSHKNGLLSQWVAAQSRIGDTVEISQAMGDFTLQDCEHPLLFIAGGSGITPFRAFLQALTKSPAFNRKNLTDRPKVSLLYFTPSREDTIFWSELIQTAKDNAWFDVTFFTTQEGKKTHLSTKLLAPYIDTSPDVYICGPAPLIEQAEEICESINSQIALYKEAFTSPVITISDDQTSVKKDIDFTKSQLTLLANQEDKTLLELAESNGLSPQSGCRMGICYTCTCQLIKGSVQNIQTGKISEAGTSVQICINKAITDISLDL